MAKPVLISGIQPTGKLHLGNYLGALKNFVELQNSGKYECFFFIADYHSLTENFNPKEKSGQILELTSDYLAAGLDHQKSTLFVQSQVPAHTELTWILSVVAPLGELNRMTQFKEKSENQKSNVNVGLFTYPVLMAADVLLYDTQFVPVGEDQLQHLELTRTLARKFNSRFGKTFTEPKAILTKTPRVMSLDDPNKKMSKSQPSGCLFLDDSPEKIKEKIKKAVTDSGKEIKFDEKNKPAISNLIRIYEAAYDLGIKAVEKKFEGKSYVEFKSELADLLIDYLKPFRGKKPNPEPALSAGAKKANLIANKKLAQVKKHLGLLK